MHVAEHWGQLTPLHHPLRQDRLRDEVEDNTHLFSYPRTFCRPGAQMAESRGRRVGGGGSRQEVTDSGCCRLKFPRFPSLRPDPADPPASLSPRWVSKLVSVKRHVRPKQNFSHQASAINEQASAPLNSIDSTLMTRLKIASVSSPLRPSNASTVSM